MNPTKDVGAPHSALSDGARSDTKVRLSAPIALDAMGGDKAPGEIVAGARMAADELGISVILVGDPDLMGDTGDLEVLPASEAIAMDEDPGRAVRTKKDSSLVRAAEAVRDGRASAMVSAGNTGAAMASALLRFGRLSKVQRPAIATIIPVPGSTPTVLLDAGANSECNAAMLVQFAQMGSAYAKDRFGFERPRVGLLSIGEEPTKGNALVKETHGLLASGAAGPDVFFCGNVEGRDVMSDRIDVVITDGFTGNIVLKTLEGGVKATIGALLEAMTSSDEVREASRTIMPALSPLAAVLDPDTYGGAVLLGVEGICVISHGSSSSRAIVNALRVASDSVSSDLVSQLQASVTADLPVPESDN